MPSHQLARRRTDRAAAAAAATDDQMSNKQRPAAPPLAGRHRKEMAAAEVEVERLNNMDGPEFSSAKDTEKVTMVYSLNQTWNSMNKCKTWANKYLACTNILVKREIPPCTVVTSSIHVCGAFRATFLKHAFLVYIFCLTLDLKWFPRHTKSRLRNRSSLEGNARDVKLCSEMLLPRSTESRSQSVRRADRQAGERGGSLA